MTDFTRPLQRNPTTGAQSVFVDGATITGNGTKDDPLVAAGSSATNSGTTTSSVTVGTPLTPRADPFHVAATDATEIDTAICIGLSLVDGDEGDTVRWQSSGNFVATTEQWDVVAGGSGGLNPGATYYLFSGGNGRILAERSTSEGDITTQIGIALSSTTMQLQIWGPVVESGAGS